MRRYAGFELARAIATLYMTGAFNARWDELYLWCGVQRVSKAPYRELQQRWIEICEANGYKGKAIPEVRLMTFGNTFTLVRDAFEDENKVEKLADKAA